VKDLRNICLLLFGLYSEIYPQSSFKPTDISGIQMWLRSDSLVTLNGSQVSQWGDISGNGNNFLETTGWMQPALIPSDTLLNNYPVIKFDGSGTRLETSFIQPNIYTIFFIYAHKVGNSGPLYSTNLSGYPLQRNTAVWPNSNAANYDLGGDSLNLRNLYVDVHDFVSDNYNTYLNGIHKGGFNSLLSASGGTFIMGYGAGEPLNGGVAEFILYDKALPDSSRKKVEKYLMDRYSKPLSLGPDIVMNTLCDTILHAGTHFNSYLWSTGETTENITISKPGTYSVAVTDLFGRVLSDSIHVYYPCNQIAKANKLCYGDTLLWNTNLNPSNYTFAWSTGATTSAINITQAGTYSVTATNKASGCFFKSDTVHVTIDNFPQVASLGPDVTFCSGNSISLISGASQAQTYQWSTGQTSSSIVITNSGTYTVTIYDNQNCSAKDSIYVKVKGINPTANFIAPAVCIGVPVNFTDSSVSTLPEQINSWNWNFGDTYTSALQNPSHTYSASGTFSVTLTTINSIGCSNIKDSVVTVPPFSQLYIPTSFTPNGDGNNDIYYVFGKCLTDMTFRIYDRWGEKIFETTDVNTGWDGMYKGEKENAGVFIYSFEGTLTTGEKVNKNGNITLIR